MEFNRNLILQLAIAGLLCANVATANDDQTTVVVTAVVTVDTGAASRDGAKTANKEAAEKAVEAMQADNQLDLDIRLIGPTSVKIASDR